MADSHPRSRDARTALLDIPLRTPTTQSPFWHREQPLLAVTHLDPGHSRLREQFPNGWGHLVRVKTLMDGIAALEAPDAATPGAHLRRIAPLLTAAAQELQCFTEAETGTTGAGAETTGAAGTGPAERLSDAVSQARTAADRLLHYAHTQEWQPVTLSAPAPGRPWLYCGPLNTWAMHRVHTPFGFLVAAPDAVLQQEIDAVDTRLPEIGPIVGRILKGPIRSVQRVTPTMRITELLLAGGESRAGHKNFAHFFPLEAPHSVVDAAEFTVVFANVHAARVRRCSFKLLDRYQGAAASQQQGEILRSSLRWFRCHDLAHFWRRTDVAGDGHPAAGLTPFERMTLEEAYADVLGLLSAASLFPTPALAQAFIAELLRYLSRRYHDFADSGAAALTAGWLIERGVSLQSMDDHWFDKAVPPLEELARCLHLTLWEADPACLGELRSGLSVGAGLRNDLAALYQEIPTDLEYTFG